MSFCFNFDVPETTADPDSLDGNELLNRKKDTFAPQHVSGNNLFNALVLTDLCEQTSVWTDLFLFNSTFVHVHWHRIRWSRIAEVMINNS